MSSLREELQHWRTEAQERVSTAPLEPRLEHVGTVIYSGDGIATVAGLPQTRLDELLQFEHGAQGMAVDLGRETMGCMLLGTEKVAAGSVVRGTGALASVPVGDALLGRIVDGLGQPLDGEGPIEARSTLPLERPAPAIVERALVNQPLATGVLAVDAMLPIGRGQRELIIGDRHTGKTALALDAMINQRSSDVLCVYAAIGQRTSTVSHVIDATRRHGPRDRCIFVIGEAGSPPGMQWLTPYAACTMAEYFMERGRDVLLVLDDLTKHAALYRQLSLLLRRPPGREAYPGDIFYIHSRLLERAAKLSPERGGGSLTALPIAETQAGNISAYIPTNLISITDGQIYFDSRLFDEDQKPAIDVGKSVSRVGGKAQPPVLGALAESLRLEYAQFLELELFTRFGTMVDERTRSIIEHGRGIRAILDQEQLAPLSLAEQVALLLASDEHLLDGISLERVDQFRRRLLPWLQEHCADALRLDERSPALGGELRDRLRTALADLAASVRAAGG